MKLYKTFHKAMLKGMIDDAKDKSTFLKAEAIFQIEDIKELLDRDEIPSQAAKDFLLDFSPTKFRS